MPSKVDDDVVTEEPPTTINPYDVLEIEETATADQVKTAYRKLALKHHPDKAPSSEKETANARFQEIAFAYAILSDPRRRSRYDATGNTSESLDIDDDDFDWTSYFREQYASALSLEILDQTKREYQGSEEERGHLLDAYRRYKGDMDKIYENVMLSNPLEDEERFRRVFDEAISRGEVEGLKRYTEESGRKRERRMERARREAEEAEEALREMEEEEEKTTTKKDGNAKGGKRRGRAGGRGGRGGRADRDADLVALIQQRQKSRAENFLDDLEARYGGGAGSKKGGSKRKRSEPEEEAFAEVASRAGNKKKKKEETTKRTAT